MYTVYAGDIPLHDPLVQLILLEAVVKKSLNAAGEFTFSIHKQHASYERLVEHDSENPIRVYGDGQLIFEGDIVQINRDFQLIAQITCREDLAYLNDSIVRPYSTLASEVSSVYGEVAPNTVDGYFEWLITKHNAQVNASKRFIIGVNQGSQLDANNYVYRSDATYPTTGSVLKEKLLDSLGGYVQIRRPEGKRIIDFLADFPKVNAQVIDFGINLLDFVRTSNGENIASFVIPKGKQTESGSTGENVLDQYTNVRGLPDGQLEDGYWKQDDMIYSAAAIDRYGWVGATVELNDVGEPENLLAKGIVVLKELESPEITIEIKAVDLSVVKPHYEPIQIGQYVRVRSAVHGIDSFLLCSEMSIDLNRPDQNQFTMGTAFSSLTGEQSKRINLLNASINAVYESAEKIGFDAKNAVYVAGQAVVSAAAAIEKAESVEEVAAAKNTVFVERPTPPYTIGDLWTQGPTGGIYTCIQARESGEYVADDWQLSSHYSDDTSANKAAEVANQAKETAETASAFASSATTEAQDAKAAASEAQTKASLATQVAQSAQESAEKAQKNIATVSGDMATTQNEVQSIKENLETVTTEMTATIESVSGLAEADKTLQAGISQNAANISSAVSEVTTLKADISGVQTDVAAVQATADAATTSANAAHAAATEAQERAEAAGQAAQDAQANAIAASTTYADNLAETLQGQIDGTIETWTGNGKPTSLNEPESSWSDDPSAPNSKQKHIGDLYYDTQSGYAYRYDALYIWVLIKDTDVTKAIGDAAQAIADAASASSAAASAADAATIAQSAAEAAKQEADEAQQAALALASRMTTAETSISQNATAISLRATKQELETLTIGGNNLVRGTADWTIPNASGSGYTINADILRSDLASMSYSWRQDIESAVYYTFCVEAISIGPMATVTIKGFNYPGTEHFSNAVSVSNNAWTRVSTTFYGRKDAYGNYLGINYQSNDIMPGDAHGIQLRHVQLVKGKKAPDWSPAYEDLMAYTDAQVKVNANAITAEVKKRTETDAKVSTLTQTADGLEVKVSAAQGGVDTLNTYLKYQNGQLELGKEGDNTKMVLANNGATIGGDGQSTVITSSSFTQEFHGAPVFTVSPTSDLKTRMDAAKAKNHFFAGAVLSPGIIEHNPGEAVRHTLTGPERLTANEEHFLVFTNISGVQEMWSFMPKYSFSAGAYVELQLDNHAQTTTVDGSMPPGTRACEYGTINNSQLDITYPINGVANLKIAGNLESDSIGDNLKQAICDYIYPIGTILHRYDHQDPSEVFGGKWTRLTGGFLYPAASTNTIGQTGGSWTSGGTALTEAQMPSHTHGSYITRSDAPWALGTTSTAYQNSVAIYTWGNYWGNIGMGWSGGSQAHSHSINPPFMYVSVWRRTA